MTVNVCEPSYFLLSAKKSSRENSRFSKTDTTLWLLNYEHDVKYVKGAPVRTFIDFFHLQKEMCTVALQHWMNPRALETFQRVAVRYVRRGKHRKNVRKTHIIIEEYREVEIVDAHNTTAIK